MRRALTKNFKNKRRRAYTGIFKTKEKETKTKTENKTKYAKLQDDKTDVKMPMKIFCKYTFHNTTVFK